MTATTIVITKTASSSSSRRRRGYRMIHGGLPWHTCEKASLGALKPRPLVVQEDQRRKGDAMGGFDYYYATVDVSLEIERGKRFMA